MLLIQIADSRLMVQKEKYDIDLYKQDRETKMEVKKKGASKSQGDLNHYILI